MSQRDELAALINGAPIPKGATLGTKRERKAYQRADAILSRYRLTLIPPSQPPYAPPELAMDTGGHQCDARDEDHSVTCQRPVNHPGRHYAQDADGYVQFLTAREVDELRQATQR